MTAARAATPVALLAAAACASGPAPARAPEQRVDAPYPGPCPPVGMVVETLPSPGGRILPDNRGVWTDEVVAAYRPGARRAETQVYVRLRHEQADDLSTQVERRPEVVCGFAAGEGEGFAPEGEGAPPPPPGLVPTPRPERPIDDSEGP